MLGSGVMAVADQIVPAARQLAVLIRIDIASDTQLQEIAPLKQAAFTD